MTKRVKSILAKSVDHLIRQQIKTEELVERTISWSGKRYIKSEYGLPTKGFMTDSLTKLSKDIGPSTIMGLCGHITFCSVASLWSLGIAAPDIEDLLSTLQLSSYPGEYASITDDYVDDIGKYYRLREVELQQLNLLGKVILVTAYTALDWLAMKNHSLEILRIVCDSYDTLDIPEEKLNGHIEPYQHIGTKFKSPENGLTELYRTIKKV